MEAILLSLIVGMLAVNHLDKEWKNSKKGAIGSTAMYLIISAIIGYICYIVAQLFT